MKTDLFFIISFPSIIVKLQRVSIYFLSKILRNGKLYRKHSGICCDPPAYYNKFGLSKGRGIFRRPKIIIRRRKTPLCKAAPGGWQSTPPVQPLGQTEGAQKKLLLFFLHSQQPQRRALQGPGQQRDLVVRHHPLSGLLGDGVPGQLLLGEPLPLPDQPDVAAVGISPSIYYFREKS